MESYTSIVNQEKTYWKPCLLQFSLIFHKKNRIWAQKAKAFSTKAKALSLVPKIHITGGENLLLHVVHWYEQAFHNVHICIDIN